jgi:hypothetical protein
MNTYFPPPVKQGLCKNSIFGLLSNNSRYELIWIGVNLRVGKDKALERVFG